VRARFFGAHDSVTDSRRRSRRPLRRNYRLVSESIEEQRWLDAALLFLVSLYLRRQAESQRLSARFIEK
jgi:hypothetical protein